MTDGVTIGQAAAFAGVTVKTVRHYHKQGERALLPDRVLAKLDKVAADLGFTRAERALDDPQYVCSVERMWRAAEWEPDDPRVDELATAMAKHAHGRDRHRVVDPHLPEPCNRTRGASSSQIPATGSCTVAWCAATGSCAPRLPSPITGTRKPRVPRRPVWRVVLAGADAKYRRGPRALHSRPSPRSLARGRRGMGPTAGWTGIPRKSKAGFRP
ncbi:MerR family transcriptional regulator [Nonomuraea thailandensis]